jgi:hypothetical protein
MQFKNNDTKYRGATKLLNFGNIRPKVQVSLARTLAILALLLSKQHLEIQDILRSKTKTLVLCEMSVVCSGINKNPITQMVKGFGSYWLGRGRLEQYASFHGLYHYPTKQSKISTIKKSLKCHINKIFLFPENHK